MASVGQASEPPLELDPTLGLLLDLLFLGVLSISIPAVLSDRTIMDQSFDHGMAVPFISLCPIFLLEVGSISSLSLFKVPLLRFLRK